MVDLVKKDDGVCKKGVRLSTIKCWYQALFHHGDIISVGNWISRVPCKSIIGGLKWRWISSKISSTVTRPASEEIDSWEITCIGFNSNPFEMIEF